MTNGPLHGAALALALLLLALPCRADTRQGLEDFRNGRFAEAYQAWQAAAAAGEPDGALFAGVLCDTGQGVVQDSAQALAWYRLAAEAGSAAGAFNVGVMYDAGRGVPVDPQQAAEWYAKAAAKGFARAEYNLGLMYEAGTGVPRSRARAIAFYTRAASHGIAAARPHLQALGQPFAGAARPAVDQPMNAFDQAQRLLLARGPAEAARAAELFRQAADQHNALAAYDLGYCYEHGLGVPRDVVQAYGWYRRALSDTADPSLHSMAANGARILEGQLTQAQLHQAEPIR